MSAQGQELIQNRLLSFLSHEDYRLIQPHLEQVEFEQGQILIEPYEPSLKLHFLESGLASQIVVKSGNRRIEVGLYGRDGFGPTSSILGVDRVPHQLMIQVQGHGFQIAAKTFLSIFDQSFTLRTLTLRYIQVFTIQTGYTASANGSSVIAERLARQLLMCHDRIDGDHIAITHGFLAIMLGVRRSGVTDAMHFLEGNKIIRGLRGHIHILDRKRLEQKAGESYGVPEAEYRRLIGPL